MHRSSPSAQDNCGHNDNNNLDEFQITKCVKSHPAGSLSGFISTASLAFSPSLVQKSGSEILSHLIHVITDMMALSQKLVKKS